MPVHVLAGRICNPDDLTQRRDTFGETSKRQRASGSNHTLSLCLLEELASNIVVLIEGDQDRSQAIERAGFDMVSGAY